MLKMRDRRPRLYDGRTPDWGRALRDLNHMFPSFEVDLRVAASGIDRSVPL